MKRASWYEFKNSASQPNETELYIYDVIGFFGVSAADFVAELQNVPASNRIVCHVHSPGGDVLEGQAIFTALQRHPGGVVTQVDGLAASMGAVIACAGNPVRMAGNALMMIHNVSGGAMGESEDLRKTADMMDKVQETITSIFVGKTGLSRKRVTELMDAETWMTASEAKELGFVDEITGDLKMAAEFAGDWKSKFKNVAALTEREHAMSKENLPTVEESQTILQKLASFFKNAELAEVTAQLTSANEKVSEFTNKIAELTTTIEAHVATIAAKDGEIAELNTKLENVTKESDKKIEDEVVKRCAAAGLRTPVKRDPDAGSADTLEDVRAQMAAETDPQKKFQLAQKCRELRSKR